jgi:hypothetical protein
MEKWKTIPSHNRYEASNEGRIRNKITGNIIGGGYNRRYLRATLDGKSNNIHRFIAEAWIPNPNNKPEINHINGNKHDNRVSNLEWSTSYENNLHARTSGLALGPKRGEKSNLSKLDDDTIKHIKSIHKPFTKEFGTRTLAKKYGVNECYLSTVLNGNKKYRPICN